MSPARKIHEIFMYCLFDEGEDQTGAVLVQGLSSGFGFHPERLAEVKEDLRKIASDVVSDEFLESKGGGMTFLRLPVGRDGKVWCEQKTSQELMCLCIASGFANYCLPRELWDMMPGGVPYLVFNL